MSPGRNPSLFADLHVRSFQITQLSGATAVNRELPCDRWADTAVALDRVAVLRKYRIRDELTPVAGLSPTCGTRSTTDHPPLD
jgi:hypothetical protein